MENITLLAVGIVLIVLGIVNMTGNISTVHSYNRKKVKEEDIPKYGFFVGLGTVTVGVGITVNFVLMLLELSFASLFVLIPAVGAGIGLILYAQFKYNGGLF